MYAWSSVRIAHTDLGLQPVGVAGGDPLLVKNTPGWQLQEVRAEDRYGPQPVGGSGRPLTRMTESLGEVADVSLDAGPKRLIEREVITVLAPLTLVARGPLVYTTDEAGRLAGGEHHLTIEVLFKRRL